MHFKFLRQATKHKDGHDGVLYLHNWGTGWQELVFPNVEEALKWYAAVTAQ
jgi:hypothetical protein